MKNIVGEEIVRLLNGFKSQRSERENLCLTLHFVVFDLQRAIHDLVKLRHIRAASALLRVVFESHVKALWLENCASEEQVTQFKKDNVKSSVNSRNSITLHEMIEQIEQAKPNLNGSLMKFKDIHWKGLNSLTHSGTMQLIGFSALENIHSASIEDREKTLIDFSNRFAISSLGNVGRLIESVEVLKTYISLSKTVLGNYI